VEIITVGPKPGFALVRQLPTWCVLVACLWAAGCGPSPTAATSTTDTATFAITPVITVQIVGQTQTWGVVNAAADSTVTWMSSDPTLLTIDSDGNSTAIAKGVVTIIAQTSTSQEATLQVQVVPNYEGTWTGQAVMIACTDIGGFASARYCAQGTTPQPVTLTLVHENLSVTGTLSKSEGDGQLSGIVTGNVGTGGDITLTGTISGLSRGANLAAALTSWNALVTDTSMTGSWSANITSPQILGIATVQWSLTGMTLAAP
jgi:hypothetical protein